MKAFDCRVYNILPQSFAVVGSTLVKIERDVNVLFSLFPKVETNYNDSKMLFSILCVADPRLARRISSVKQDHR